MREELTGLPINMKLHITNITFFCYETEHTNEKRNNWDAACLGRNKRKLGLLFNCENTFFGQLVIKYIMHTNYYHPISNSNTKKKTYFQS
jgi:hypothetical protein